MSLFIARCAIAAASLVAIGTTGVASAENPNTIYQDTPTTGTHITKPIAVDSFPLDATYDELTPAQKQAFRSQYENLPADTDPPYPLHGTRHMMKSISIAQQALQENGELSAIVNVDPYGKVKNVAFYAMPSKDVAKVVTYVMLREPFKPANCGGKRCAMEFPLNLTFRVEYQVPN
ncbi:hypothetical protein [Solimonas marina]|uniref:TonB C-terminal domain-containing protein n=1 Tax=Solimonas marina TaxID=2714601 RepID=A0A969WFB6_9GAMM|nr:hypothetical protein [Solimonas marina]NKF23700.1 hypothetical protein [Solimonas marina]